MSRARDLSNFVNPAAISVDGNFNVGINSVIPDVKLDVVGVVSATSFTGDGANLSNITATTATNAEGLTGTPDITVGSVTGAAATFSGPVNIDDTTESTSTSTGALIVDGGVGIAKSLHVGGNLSVGGTVTYEDVTNVDSIGVITARSGVHFGEAAAGTLVEGNATGIGIGTDNPDTILHLEGNDPTITLIDNSGTNDIATIESLSGALRFTARDGNADGEVIFRKFDGTTHDETLRITNAGNIGIGTNNPSSKLVVEGSNQQIICQLNNGRMVSLYGGTASNLPAITFSDGLRLFENEGTGEVARVSSAGSFGIGNADPQQLLHVWPDTANTTSAFIRVTSGDRNSNTGIDLGSDADGDGRLNVVSNGNLKLYTNNDEKVRITSTGRVAIGSDNDDGNALVTITGLRNNKNEQGTLALRRTINNGSGNDIGVIEFGGPTTELAAMIKGVGDAAWVGDTPGRIEFHTTSDGDSSPTEKLRIDNEGRFLLNGGSGVQSGMWHLLETKNSADSGNKFALRVRNRNTNASAATEGIQILHDLDPNDTNALIQGRTGSNTRFTLRNNGGLANFQANDSNLSDERMKKNIVDVTTQWDVVKAWEVKNFNFNFESDSDPLHIGAIAQQIETISPEVVDNWDNETDTKSLKEQQMMWMAIKALQEAQARIETLEAEVAALKAG